jgi:cytochrome P450
MTLNPIAAVTQRDPYSYYRRLLAERPVYRDDALDLWIVSSAAAVSAVLESKAGRVRPMTEPVPRALAGSAAGGIFGNLVRMNDGARHTAMKQSVMRILGAVEEAEVAREARDWLARRLVETGDALCDGTLNGIIFELPVAVVASIAGVPRDLVPAATASIADFVRAIAPGSALDQLDKGKTGADRLVSMFMALSHNSSGVVRDLQEASRSDAAAAIANAIGFLSQTYEATAGLVGNALLAATIHRDAYQRATDHDRVHGFVREVLRHDPPIHNTRRFLAEDLAVGGHTLRAGEAVLLVLAAANHDQGVNARPDLFDIDRPERRNFTFGLGRHACPGEAIATAIAAVAVEMLVPRLTELDRLAERVSYRPSANARIPVFGGRSLGSEPAATETGARAQ